MAGHRQSCLRVGGRLAVAVVVVPVTMVVAMVVEMVAVPVEMVAVALATAVAVWAAASFSLCEALPTRKWPGEERGAGRNGQTATQGYG